VHPQASRGRPPWAPGLMKQEAAEKLLPRGAPRAAPWVPPGPWGRPGAPVPMQVDGGLGVSSDHSHSAAQGAPVGVPPLSAASPYMAPSPGEVGPLYPASSAEGDASKPAVSTPNLAMTPGTGYSADEGSAPAAEGGAELAPEQRQLSVKGEAADGDLEGFAGRPPGQGAP